MTTAAVPDCCVPGEERECFEIVVSVEIVISDDFCVWMPREADVQYFVDHGGGEYFVVTNIEGVRIRFQK
jgi:hypothetical protein